MIKLKTLLAYSVLILLSIFSMSRGHTLAASSVIRIAIIDTGIDVNHPYLRDYIYTNHGEKGLDALKNSKESNSEDDDNNGYVDDIHGWNFAENNNDLTDTDGHGTHVAGIIRNVIEKSSPHLRFELLPIKYYTKEASPAARTTAFLQAIEYAIKMDVNIINISAGGHTFNKNELKLLNKASKKGILVVASAGNKKPEVAHRAFYPASYELPNIISVVAVDQIGNILPTSNLNIAKPNVYAFGQDIYSALPNNQYGTKTGSSQAAAVITGQIAKYIDEGRQFNSDELQKGIALLGSSPHNSLFVSNTAK